MENPMLILYFITLPSSSVNTSNDILTFQSMMTRKVPSHHCVAEHDVSRSYQPSATGIAAYYQAEQAGGLAVCPPLPRVPSSHHLHGESPAEEVGRHPFNL